MNITVRQIEFQKEGRTVYGWIYTPSGQIKAVVQIVHGMAEHMGRYHEWMRYLAHNGYATCGIDQIGHGRTAQDRFGYFAEQNGWRLMLECQRKFNKIVRSELPGKPVVLLGHSMGSFVARICAARFAGMADAMLLSGTARGGVKLELAIQLANRSVRKNGSDFIDHTIHALAFGGFNRKFLQENSPNAWLSRDEQTTSQYAADPMCGFVLSASGYRDLFILMRKANEKACFAELDCSMPVMLFAGTDDPVGEYGKGPREVCDRYAAAGVSDLQLLLYQGGRHEMLAEFNREQVYKDVLVWLEERFGERTTQTVHK